MSPPIVQPLASGALNGNPGETGWKLNQQLLATVVNGADGSKKLRISGNLYSPLNLLHAELGQTLKLTVKSLSPFVELALNDTVETTQLSERGSGIILSESIRLWAGQNLQADSSGIVLLISLLKTLTTQQLPEATKVLVAALFERLVTPRILTSPGTLKSALLGVCLSVEGSTGSVTESGSGEDLKSLLLQLIRSLSATNITGKNLDIYGLSLYQGVGRYDSDLIMLLVHELGKELSRTIAKQEQFAEASDECEHRWIYELPVHFQDRLRSIYLRIFKKRFRHNVRHADREWEVEFEFGLPNLGDLRIEMSIEGLNVSVTAVCTKHSTNELVTEKQDALKKRLEYYGLCLAALQCFAVSDSESHTRQTAGKKVTAVAENIPLRNFEMRENSSERNPINGIPDIVYCAMAGLFSLILEVDEEST